MYTQHKKLASSIYRNLFFLIGLIFIALPFSYSQIPANNNSSFAYIVQDIDQRLGQGDKMAFRDLANIWQQRPNDKGFVDMARRYLLVDSLSFGWSADTLPQQLLAFYYEQADSLIFSDFLKIYYLQPIEERSIKTKLIEQQPLQRALHFTRILKENINYALDKKKGNLLQESLIQLAQVGTVSSRELLKEVAKDKRLRRIQPIAKRQEIISSVLSNLPDSTALKALFLLIKDKQISFTYCRNKFAEITNHYCTATNLKELSVQEVSLQKEFKRDFKAIRQAGYQKSLKSRALFFEEDADYFAWILATTPKDTLPWIKENALVDMLKTKQPQVLFYLAGLQFQQWRAGKKDRKYLNLLNKMADIRLQVEDGNGQMVTVFEDETAQLNFLIYWAKHFKDYEWEERGPGYFTNILHKSEIIESYEKYFRRLNSPNDSAALEAFLILTEGVPMEVNRLMKKYRSLLRSYNATLPPLKFNVIENISYLTDFCNKQGYIYKPTPAIEAQLIALGKRLKPKNRLQIENDLIAHLKLEELTALEYWASIHAQKIELNYSVGRILDRLYTKYWERITSEEEQFRFFLLKSIVFRKLTSFGIGRLYHKKGEGEEQVRKLLQEIELVERNELIKEAIEFWQKGETEDMKGISVQELLVDPESFDKEKINKLPKFSQKELASFFFTLKGVRNRKALKKMERYLSTYASTEMVPELFGTPKEHWESNASAAKVIVKILESIYGYSFSKNYETSLEQWYALWESSETPYQEWGKRLFYLQLGELKSQEKLRISDINSVTRSSNYLPSHRDICLEALKKIEKTRSISQLSIEPLLSVDKELHYLEDITFSYRNLDNLSKILVIDKPLKLLDYMLRQMQAYTIDERGFLLNNLLRQDWLFQLINREDFPNIIKQKLSAYLEDYLNESEYLTEFEEQATQLNLLLLQHNEDSIQKKLLVLNDANLENKVKEKWLNIIFADIKFEEIKTIFPSLSVLQSFEEEAVFKFIYKDFGLPIFDLASKEQTDLLEKRLKTLSERKVYQKYLTEFGIDFKQKNSKLDFQKIYDILKYDLVIPFIGEGGQYRDYYVYAIIKLLELHFKTSLGFSDKLNDYQTFFQFNSFARVKAWKKYLLDHKYVKRKSNNVPSFNEGF